MSRTCLTIILAAGEGTRMKSDLTKVLHPVAGLSMVGHVVKAAEHAGGTATAGVVGPNRNDVAAEIKRLAPHASIHVQSDRLGTAHAALMAESAIAKGYDDVLIVFGDTPLVTASTFERLRTALSAKKAGVVVLAFEAKNPHGYGRVVMEGGKPIAIVEEKDCNDDQRKIGLCNGGLMALDGKKALTFLKMVGNHNAKSEYYLTDIVALAVRHGTMTAVELVDEEEIQGVNDRVQLASAEAVAQRRLREAAMRQGVTMIAPETVFMHHDTVIGRDCHLEPHVVFGPGVILEPNVAIKAYSHLAGCTVKSGASIGPFARIRPKSVIGEGAHIGNFVEINRTTLGAHVEANHLSYVGDATVGEGTNIGAGTITCNFDGANKHQTMIGKDVFVGSNSTLVAPLTIGDASLIAAGSTLTKNVESGALVFGRARQESLAGKGSERIAANKVKRAARKAAEKAQN